jgi:hypothetical protein
MTGLLLLEFFCGGRLASTINKNIVASPRFLFIFQILKDMMEGKGRSA